MRVVKPGFIVIERVQCKKLETTPNLVSTSDGAMNLAGLDGAGSDEKLPTTPNLVSTNDGARNVPSSDGVRNGETRLAVNRPSWILLQFHTFGEVSNSIWMEACLEASRA